MLSHLVSPGRSSGPSPPKAAKVLAGFGRLGDFARLQTAADSGSPTSTAGRVTKHSRYTSEVILARYSSTNICSYSVREEGYHIHGHPEAEVYFSLRVSRQYRSLDSIAPDSSAGQDFQSVPEAAECRGLPQHSLVSCSRKPPSRRR